MGGGADYCLGKPARGKRQIRQFFGGCGVDDGLGLDCRFRLGLRFRGVTTRECLQQRALGLGERRFHLRFVLRIRDPILLLLFIRETADAQPFQQLCQLILGGGHDATTQNVIQQGAEPLRRVCFSLRCDVV